MLLYLIHAAHASEAFPWWSPSQHWGFHWASNVNVGVLVTVSTLESEFLSCVCAVGTLAAQCAFFRGASRVVLIDREADRLQFAKDRIPKLETLNFSKTKARLLDCFAAVYEHHVAKHQIASTTALPDFHQLGHSHCTVDRVLSHLLAYFLLGINKLQMSICYTK